MKRQVTLLIALLVSALLAVPAMAADQEVPKQNAPAKGKGKQTTASKVPKAQLDTVKKREEARKKRDEKLKIRDMNVNAGN